MHNCITWVPDNLKKKHSSLKNKQKKHISVTTFWKYLCDFCLGKTGSRMHRKIKSKKFRHIDFIIRPSNSLVWDKDLQFTSVNNLHLYFIDYILLLFKKNSITYCEMHNLNLSDLCNSVNNQVVQRSWQSHLCKSHTMYASFTLISFSIRPEICITIVTLRAKRNTAHQNWWLQPTEQLMTIL